MIKKILLVAVASLSVAACNNRASTEDQTCSYNLEKNEKVCNMTRSEREDTLKATYKAADPIKVVDGRSYREQEDGTLKPIN